MVRVVKDLRNNHIVTTNARKAVDTYARPYYHVHNSLASVADALEKWNPVFVNVARKKEQERYNREVEEGKAIAMQYAGKDYTLDQIENDIKSGNSDRYRKLSFAMKEGINQMQMEQGLNSVSMKMFEAYDDATFPDANGNPHRLYEAKDPMAFQKWFDGKFNELWEAETGGKYDQSLYGELGSKVRATVQNSLYNQFLKARGEMKQYEADKAMVGVLDTYLTPLMDRGKFVGNSKALGDIRATIDRLIAQRDLAGGAGDGDRVATNVLLMKMGEADTQPEVNFLADAARGSKLWNNAEYRSKIETFVKRKEEQFKQEAKQKRIDAYQNARMALGYVEMAERRRALAGEQLFRNTLANKAPRDADGKINFNRANESMAEIMEAVKGNPYATAQAYKYFTTHGRNIALEDKLKRELYFGASPEIIAPYIKSGAVDTSFAVRAMTETSHSNYQNARSLYIQAQKYFDNNAEPIDQFADVNDKRARELAKQQFAQEVAELTMNAGTVNIESPDFQNNFNVNAANRIAVWGSSNNWKTAEYMKTKDYFGDIMTATRTDNDVKNFFGATDILTDPDFNKIVGRIVQTRGGWIPDMNSPTNQVAEEKLAAKGYMFGNVPIKRFIDVQFIAHDFPPAELNVVTQQLKGND